MAYEPNDRIWDPDAYVGIAWELVGLTEVCTQEVSLLELRCFICLLEELRNILSAAWLYHKKSCFWL